MAKLQIEKMEKAETLRIPAAKCYFQTVKSSLKIMNFLIKFKKKKFFFFKNKHFCTVHNEEKCKDYYGEVIRARNCIVEDSNRGVTKDLLDVL